MWIVCIYATAMVLITITTTIIEQTKTLTWFYYFILTEQVDNLVIQRKVTYILLPRFSANLVNASAAADIIRV